MTLRSLRRRIWDRATGTRQSEFSARQRLRRAAQYAVDPLEQRVLLSTINWVNRVVSDNFAANYGANAATARTIVDRAIADWERVIVNFNYSGGGNTYNLTLNANPISGRGVTSGVTRNDAVQKKPNSATITIDDNAQGGGWYFDTVPGTSTVPDDGEFTTLLSPFAAMNATTDNDFYRTVVHEMGHAMGILDSSGFLKIGDFLSNGVVDPNNAAETLRLLDFNGGGTDYTLTTDGGGHMFEGGGAYAGPIHPNDLLNDGRTVALNTNIRELISEDDATLLRDVYGYTIALPSTIDTFYANLNTTTNVVTVTGDINPNGSDADIIDLELTGASTGDLRVEANGTTEIFPDVEYTSIVVNALLDNDDVDVDELESGKTCTVNGGDGNDRIDVAAQTGDVDTDLNSNFTANGGIGTDTLHFHDQNDGAGGDDWTVSSTSVTKNASFINRVVSYGTMETMVIDGSANADVFNIVTISSTLTATMNGSAGNDIFNVASATQDIDNSILGTLNLVGGADSDTINLDDTGDAGDETYDLAPGSLAKPTTPLGTLTFSGHETLVLTANPGNDTINIQGFGNSVNVTVNGGDGNDTITNPFHDLNTNWNGNLAINGGVGTDSVVLDDGGDLTATEYTLTSVAFGVTGGVTTNLFTYGTMESFDWTFNTVGTTMQVPSASSAVAYTLNGSGGADIFNLGNVGGNAEALNAAMAVNGDAGTDTINYLDSANGFANTYTITSTTLTRTSNGLITYGTAEELNVTGGSAAEIYNITSSLSTTPLTILGGVAADTFNIGNPGSLADNCDAATTLTGAGGADQLNYNDANSVVAGAVYTLTSTTISHTGAGLVTFGTTESVVITGSNVANTFNVNAIASIVALTVNGNQGNDVFNIGNGDMDSNLFGTLAIDGGPAPSGDSVRFDDTTDGLGADSYTIQSTTLDKPNFTTPINYTNFETQVLQASPNADSILMTSSFPDWIINGNAGADTIDIQGNQAGSTVTVDGGTGLDIVLVNSDGVGNASILFPTTQDLASLSINTGGTATIATGGNKVLYTQALTIAATGKLDMTDEDMIIDYAGASPIATIQALITSGFNSAGWTGNGIQSSTAAAIAVNAGITFKTAIGYADANTIGSPGIFSGIPIDATAVLVKYTWYGDAQLDGKVDSLDFNALATNFGTNGRRWVQGNFNFDPLGTVDSLDFNALATNFGQAGL